MWSFWTVIHESYLWTLEPRLSGGTVGSVRFRLMIRFIWSHAVSDDEVVASASGLIDVAS
jgi:hypothetical protein